MPLHLRSHLVSGLALLALAAPPAGAQIAINEIHYHPPDLEELEFVEVINAGAEKVNLEGFRFSEGIFFDFPALQLAPGELAVVAREPGKLAAAYGLDPSRVLGPNQRLLANFGERLVLKDPSGKFVDMVSYSDRFPWPIAADGYGEVAGKGYSLERRCPGKSAQDLANWAPSAKDAPTPGLPNRAATCDLPAIVLSFQISPERIRVSDRPTLNVALSSPERVAGAKVEFFVDDREKTGEAKQEVALRDDGTEGDAVAADGVFTAVFPPQPANSVVRYRILIDQGQGFAAAYPRLEDPFAWEGYFVDSGLTSKNTIYHVFISKANWAKMESNITGNRLSPTWNDEVPATLVSEGVVYDPQVRYAGSTFNRLNGRNAAFSCSNYTAGSNVNVKAWHLNFPRWRLLRGDTERLDLRKGWVSGFTGYHDRLAYHLFGLAGVPAPRTRFAKLYVNGCYYHFFSEVEIPDDNMMGRFFNEVGDLFKSVGYVGDQGPFTWGDERTITAGGGYTALQRYQATYERKSHRERNDHAALIALIEGLNRARPKGPAALREYLEENFDVEECLNYLATVNYIVPWDDMWQNHYLYQKAEDGKWIWMAWDLDQTLGGPCCCADVSATSSIYRGANRSDVGNRSGWWSYLKDSFFLAMPDEYLARVLDLNNRVYPPAVLEAAIDEFAAEVGTEADVVPVGSWGNAPRQMELFIRKFVNDRHRYLNSLVVAVKLGPPLCVRPGEAVLFDTVGSKPPLGPGVTYTWSNGMVGDKPSTTFADPGIYRITLTISARGASASAERIIRVSGGAGPPFLEQDGRVVFEAESFSQSFSVEAIDAWKAATETPGYAGSGYMTSSGLKRFLQAGYSTLAPELLYPIRFSTPGSYQIWARTRAKSSSFDSASVALDCKEFPTSRYLQVPLGAEFVWTRGLLSTGPLTIDVPAGDPTDHSFSLYVREAGLEVDRILLTLDPAFTPEGIGPPESPRASTETRGPFMRGDANRDGAVDLTDVIALLDLLFQGHPESVPCRDAADSNDDGALDVSDAIYTISFVYLGGSKIPPPYPESGLDPTPEDPYTCGDSGG